MRPITLATVCVLCLAPLGVAQNFAQPAIDLGRWRAWFDCPGGELPFTLDFTRDSDGTLHAAIINDPERIEVPIVRLDGHRLVLRFDDYDSEIRAHVSDDNDELEGQWFKAGKGGSVSEMDFHAVAGEAPRFPEREAQGTTRVPIDGRWRVMFSSTDEIAIGAFRTVAGGAGDKDRGADVPVEGTILTPTGDYRYLAGDYDGAALRLSCFDGSHAFLLTAKAEPGAKPDQGGTHEDQLAGDFWSGSSWHETWKAIRDPHATLPDAFTQTSAAQKTPDLASLVYTDLDGKRVSLADLRKPNRPMIVEIFGSWCPNCADAGDDLAAIQKEYRKAGLTVVGLAFERTDDFDQSAERVRAYAKRHGITYPLLIAGTASKESVAKAFPLIDQLRAFPTTVFIDADGKVRAVHTGYSGPATGVEHEKLKAGFDRVVREMLDEVIK